MSKKKVKEKKIAAAVAEAIVSPPVAPPQPIIVPPDILYCKVGDNGGVAGVHHDIQQLINLHGTANVVRYKKVSEGKIHNDTFYVDDEDEDFGDGFPEG